MTNRQLKWISVLLPLIFMTAVIYAHDNLVPPNSLEGDLYTYLAVVLGAIIFSIIFFGYIERREEEVVQTNRQLEALHEAALALTTELDLQNVLQKVVDISRSLLHAKYGALGVADLETARIKQFITSGVTEEERGRIGAPPQGHGLLGVLLNPEGEPLIVNDIKQDPRSVGFPPNHPPMKSLLGVPIKSKGEIFGNLYVADRYQISPSGEENLLNFSRIDIQLLEKFATQAAIAIENAQLYRKTQELAILQERERFGMALHDGIMQLVYATGLSLQEAQHQIEKNPSEAQRRVNRSINDLSQVLRDLRNYILGLRTGRYQGQNLASSLAQMARELHANTLMNVHFTPPPKVTVLGLSDSQTDELVYIVQEALNNIRKHAYAQNVDLSLRREDKQVILTIDDDGVGFDMKNAADKGGNGLRNMGERALELEAGIRVWSQKGKGTHIQLSVPLEPEKENSQKS
jgi:signal transduction histidine kinase